MIKYPKVVYTSQITHSSKRPRVRNYNLRIIIFQVFVSDALVQIDNEIIRGEGNDSGGRATG